MLRKRMALADVVGQGPQILGLDAVSCHDAAQYLVCQ